MLPILAAAAFIHIDIPCSPGAHRMAHLLQLEPPNMCSICLTDLLSIVKDIALRMCELAAHSVLHVETCSPSWSRGHCWFESAWLSPCTLTGVHFNTPGSQRLTLPDNAHHLPPQSNAQWKFKVTIS